MEPAHSTKSPRHDVIVIGASAGGVEALLRLVRGLPPDLAAALFIVLHVSPQGTSLLPALLGRAGKLPAAHPADGAQLRHGQIYVAPPDHHLLIEAQGPQGLRLRVLKGPKENRQRPAIDPLFRSAAGVCGARVVGVVLSGTLDDGSAGLVSIKRGGGVTVVQDPEDASYPGMPRNALAAVKVDHCLPVPEIARLLVRLAGQGPGGGDVSSTEGAAPEADRDRQVEVIKMNTEIMESDEKPNGQPSAYSCPDCGGVLWELGEEGILRFRCRVGHAFSPGSMLAEQSEATERALWVALKILEERVSLLRRMHDKATERGQKIVLGHYSEHLREAQERAALVRRLLLREDPPGREVVIGEHPLPEGDRETG
jgi:two-component system, chemotaxis family, protein-glutamate methylesterase/glutaminase